MKQKNWMLLILAGVLSLFGAFSFQAQAQDYVYATGNPNFGVDYPIPGGFINITNGNVHITIPLGSFKQRGSLPPVKINLEYDSRIWKINDNGGNYSWQPNNVPNSMAGWRLTTGLEGTSSSFEMIEQPYPSEYTNGCANPYSNQYNDYMNLITRFQWTDPQGTKHLFDVQTVGPGFQCKYVASNYPYVSSTSGYAIDNSGYYLEVTNYTDMTVYDSSGNQVYTSTTPYASAQIYNTSSGNTSTIIDPNGNMVEGVDTDSTTGANEDASVCNPYGAGVDTDASVVDSLYKGSTAPGRTIFNTTTDTAPTGAETITYNVLKEGGGTNPFNPFTVTTMPISFSTDFEQSDVSDFNGNDPSMPVTIQSIRLPDGSSYSFTYDSGANAYDPGTNPPGGSGNYGELTSMTLPTGGVVSFNYTNYFDSYNNYNRWISSVTDSYGTTYFGPRVLSTCSSGGVGCQEQVALTLPSGDFKQYTLTLNNGAWDGETDTWTSSGSDLTTVVNNYDFTSNPCWNPYVCTGAQNITASSSTVTLASGQTAQTVYSYIYGRLLSSSQEYDYGASSPTRETYYTYGSGPNGSSPVSLIQKWFNGGPFRQTAYNYDSLGRLTSEVQGGGGPPGSGIQPLAQTATTSYTYDHYGPNGSSYGMRISKTDPNGNTTSYTYSPTCNYSYLSQTTYPTTNGISHTTSVNPDCSSGDPLSTTDENGQKTSYGYDGFGRKTSILYPDGGQTSYSYPSPTQVVESKLVYGSTSSTVTTTFDGYGQKSNVSQFDPAGDDIVTYSYDANGRLQCKSNPERSGSAPTDGKTCYTYDALDRVTLVNQPDGSTIQVSYNGNQATVTDENGHQKRYQYDAFHDLTAVWEPNASGALAWETTYTYNGAGQLTGVNQAGDGSHTALTRTFVYDNLGRMTSEQTPESGTKYYAYDLNGNLTSSTNGSNTISYTYDALNRMTGKSGNGFDYTYTYDALSGFTNAGSNTIGRLVEESNNVNAGSFFMYDPMGRIIYQANCIPSNCSPSANIETSQYDLVGDLTSFTYPDGRVVTQTFDSAQHLTGIQNASTNTPYYSATAFAPTGETTNATFGNGVQMAASFNSRQSITALNYGIPNQTPLWSKQYTWAANAKNLLQIADASTISQPQTYNYTYDPDNRLVTAGGGGATLVSNATSGTGSITITDNENASPSEGEHCNIHYVCTYDYGTITATIDGTSYTVNYSMNSNVTGCVYDFTCADALAAAINNDAASTVNASVSGNTVMLSTKATGSNTNYSLSASTASSAGGSFYLHPSLQVLLSGSTLTAGVNAVYSGADEWAETYSIDPWGNQKQSGNFNFVQPYTTTNQISATGYNYDAAGDLVSDGIGNSYSYDAEGMLTSSNGAQYVYDALQQRVAKVGGSHAGEVVYFGGRAMALYNPSSGAWTDMIWAGGNLLGEVVGSQAPEYRLLDHEGSVVATTDGSGNVTGSDLLTPYGQAVSNSTGDAYLYTGLDQDAINGSDHAWYRNYSVAQSRWLRPDPYNGSYDLLNPQSLNRYNYVENNPLVYVDPSGEAGAGVLTGVGGGVCQILGISTGGINPCDPASFFASSFDVTVACGFMPSSDTKSSLCGQSGWTSAVFTGNNKWVGTAINDTIAYVGYAAQAAQVADTATALATGATATGCLAGGPVDPACDVLVAYDIYTVANDLFAAFWAAFGPAQFTGSLVPRPADLSGLGTSKIGIPNQNLSIGNILGQPSLGAVPSPGMKLP